MTLYRTWRELQALHAFFARDRGRPPTVSAGSGRHSVESQGIGLWPLYLHTIKALLSANQSRAEVIEAWSLIWRCRGGVDRIC